MKIRFVLIALLMIMLTSCRVMNEVNDRSFAEAIGIDREGRDYIVSILLSEVEDEKISRSVVSARGRNVGDALDKVKSRLPKELFLGHTKMIVLSRNIDDIEESSVFSDGNSGLSPSVILGYAPGGAENILRNISEKNKEDLNKIFLHAEKQGSILKNNVVDAYNCGMLAVLMEEDDDGLVLRGAVKMGKSPKIISEDDCRIINLIEGRLSAFGMNVRGKNGIFYADAECRKSRIYISKTEDALKFTVKIDCRAEFSEQAYEKSADPERDFKIMLSDEIEDVMKRHYDISGIGKRILLKYPEFSGLSENELNEMIENSQIEVIFG